MAIVERARQHWVAPRDVILTVPMIPTSSNLAFFHTGPRPAAFGIRNALPAGGLRGLQVAAGERAQVQNRHSGISPLPTS